MSPRRNRRPTGDLAPPERPGGGHSRIEHWPDGDWEVRPISGAAAVKVYRCPGCDHPIPIGMAHLVSWPYGEPGDAGLERRRHWHPGCWNARDRRRPPGR